jgi:predicted esterase
MAQRNQYNLRGQSIDSTIRDSSPRPEHGTSHGSVDDEGSERHAILPDIERSASPATSTWSLENPENPFNPTQSANLARPQRRDSTIASSESDSLGPGHDTPRSQSNHVRWSYQPISSSSNLEIDRTLPEHHLQEDFETLIDRQDNIPTHRRDDRPRIPTPEELLGLPVKARIIPPKGKESVENIIIVLHDHSGNEHFLQDFAEKNLRPKDTACLLLRGVSAVARKVDSYQWEDNDDAFLKSSKAILDDVISILLINKCNFPARKIIIFGQGEGAVAALTIFSAWERVEFGGVICVGGQLPPYIASPGDTKSKTAVLLLGGSLGMTTPLAKHRIEQNFSYVDCDLLEGKYDALPRSRQQLKSLKDFFSHRLHEEEWTKPAVITFGKPIRAQPRRAC